MKHSSPIQCLLLSLAILFPSVIVVVQAGHLHQSDLQVFHIYSPSSPLKPLNHLSWEDTVLQMQSKDESRIQFLLSSLVAAKSVAPIGSGRQVLQSPSYIVKGEFGTPSQTLLVALDNSNDAAWIPCSGCVGCSPTVFDPSKSSTFTNLSCGAAQCTQVPNRGCADDRSCAYNFTYGSSSIQAKLSQDTLKLAKDSISSFTFGCVKATSGSPSPPQGLLGLGRGPLSLLSQTDSLYKSTFSYCLPSFKSTNFAGSLRLGPIGQPKKIKTTPLLKNSRRSSLYYVKLVGIKVGKKLVNIPPSALDFNPTTGAGTIFDSGTSFTSLVKPAYIAVRDEFRTQMGNTTIVTSLGGFDTCYVVPITIPSITFLFDGMQVALPLDNFLIRSTAGNTACLAMAAAPDNVNSVLNVIANMQQQNHRILFDIPNSRIGVSRQFCS